ncbi:hypothetical protein IJ670_08080 [bacterium]|nr:hypothetical protein [bacterium]
MSKISFKCMIFIEAKIVDNFTMMRGIIFKILFMVFVFFEAQCFALEKIGIITDTILTPVNYYNAYFKTPEFFASDVRSELLDKGVNVVALDDTRNLLKKAGIRQYDLEVLQGMQQGYNLDYTLLKKITKQIGVSKLVVVTMGMDIQRDFLKNTLWNVLNVSGMDVVNPTHRVSVYVALVDVKKEVVL